MKNASKRNYAVDLAKVISMLWIIGVWHLASYSTQEFSPSNWPFTGPATHAFMGVFTFWGGYYLHKYQIKTLKDAKDFYVRRFSRFYILYLISIATLYVGGLYTIKPWFKSTQQLVLTIMGLSAFRSPYIGTLWFMGMLMFFYLITPIINSGKDIKTKSLIACLLLIPLVTYKIIFPNHMDARFFMLYITYMTGLIIPHNVCETILKKKVSILIGIILFLLWGYYEADNIWMTIGFRIIYSIGFIMALSGVCFQFIFHLQKSTSFCHILSFLSYCMLSAYLFHRQIYQFLSIIFNYCHIDVNIYILYAVYLPVCLVVAYMIQKTYDSIYVRIVNHKIG